MLDVKDYEPSEAGKYVVNCRNKLVKLRKYHLTEEEMISQRKKWEVLVKDVPESIKIKAHPNFFNPYRVRGVYFGQVQALYLLGANSWHPYKQIRDEMEKFMSSISVVYNGKSSTSWEKFSRKTPREGANKTRDIFGKIHENMIIMQRLNKLNPYGYKLRQVSAAIDIKRISVENISKGIYLYRLSTYDSPEKAIPMKL